ncbi:hypothetical protein ES703_34072 [subsurface metagenome]
MAIKLGDKVKDNITGFEGVAVARVVYLNGCISIQVKPAKLKKDGSMIEAEWLDEQRLTFASKAKAGGPQERPPEMHP